MKKIILTLLVACSFVALNAQTENAGERKQRRGGNPAEMVEKRTQDMVKKYALSTEQAEKVKALNEKYLKRDRPNRNIKDGNEPPRPPKNGEKPKDKKDFAGKDGKKGPRGMRPNMEEYNNELKKILNEAQYKAYTADMEKMRAEREKRRANQEKK